MKFKNKMQGMMTFRAKKPSLPTGRPSMNSAREGGPKGTMNTLRIDGRTSIVAN